MEPKALGRERHEILPGNTIFVIISFEGPDLYSQAGGLGVRVKELSRALAENDFETHVIFVGDPGKPGEEHLVDGKLILHRWCQWISQYYPQGVYQGEEQKLYDFNNSVPWYVMDKIVKPAAAQNRLVVIMGEEWQASQVVTSTSDLLYYHGLRNRVLMLWNANHTMSFHRIDWGRLGYVATITTVSRYMKHHMWGMGLNPVVVPNGIPRRMLKKTNGHDEEFRRVFNNDLVLFKVGRWCPHKRWNMAIEAVASLKRMGVNPLLLMRGGQEPYGEEVLHNARSLGLTVKEMNGNNSSWDSFLSQAQGVKGADVVNLKFYVDEDLASVLYSSSNAVLANSGIEPFGLVGLEAMAAGGLVFTGSSGEDYVRPFQNAIVLETSDQKEIVKYLLHLKNNPEEEQRIRREARTSARNHTWDEIIKILVWRLEYIAMAQQVQIKRNAHG